MDLAKQTQTVSWDDLPAETIVKLHEQLVRKGTADDWFKLGKKVLPMPGGRAPAERAFARALRMDPKLKDQIVAARKEILATQPARPASRPHAPDNATAATQPAGV